MAAWDKVMESEGVSLVAAVCEPRTNEADARRRDVAWKKLLVLVAPHIEKWARRSAALRRARLDTEDDARSILVDTIARLSRNDFANLRAFLARQPLPPADEAAETVERWIRLWPVGHSINQGCVERAAPVPPAEHDLTDGTPLRGWLFGLVRYASLDHVKQRLGRALFATGASESAGGASLSRRDLGTDAERIDASPEPSMRPPITDMLTLRQLVDEVRAFMEAFPAPMREAVELWLDDLSWDEIAARLSLESPERARALARAGQARLRDRFRQTWPEMIASR